VTLPTSNCFWKKGKDLGFTGDTELIERLDQMRKDMKLETMEDLEKAATAQGISYEDFKQNMRSQIITQKI
jgi:peptidyl-prolyl cis-trans isomerase SurA